MAERAPLIDTRDADKVAAQVKELLKVYARKWKDNDPLGTALINIFARFAELIIERLNQTPDKNFLAFLDLLGAARLPPQPARVPLTFSLAEGATVDAVVPAGTQVGAAPPAGEEQPVLFETERDLVVTSARLQSLFMRDPKNDKYADRSAILAPEWTGEVSMFQGEHTIEHSFYLGHKTLLACTAIQNLKLDVKLATPGNSLSLQWEIWDGKEGIKLTLTAEEDGTAGLSNNGEVVFRLPPAFPELAFDTLTNRWLRCRLKTSITIEPKTKLPTIKLPTIKEIKLKVWSAPDALRLDAAAVNALPLDLSKEFFPFGEKSKLGDSFYLTHREAFSRVGAKVVLFFSVVEPNEYIQAEAGVQIIPASRSIPKLVWEFWNGRAWREFSLDTDDSASFTKVTKEGLLNRVVFTVPGIEPTIINGIESYWIRARISEGNYGKDGEFGPVLNDKGELDKDEKGQIKYKLSASTLVPPQLAWLTVEYIQEAKPEAILTVNDFARAQVEKDPETGELKAFQPFLAATETTPALYLGFSLPMGRTAFPNRPLSLYFSIAEVEYQSGTESSSTAPQLAWEYWDGKAWVATSVYDETEALAHSGLVIWLAPADIALRADFGLSKRYWLRVRLASGAYPKPPIDAYPKPPRLRRVLLNTMMAVQTMTLMNEVLGSSDGSKGQRFRTNHAPVLSGQQLEVEEAERPTASECAKIREEEGEDAIRALEAVTARQAVWVRWHEVPDFYASRPRDRHYVLDHINGEVRFGDGQNGLIPPRGVGNIRLARYRTGDGARDVPTGVISQLKTTVPYVDQVTNPEPALGGADAESEEALRRRTPRQLRHGGRAVTRDDYHDLALLASPEVMRARCVPLWDPSQEQLFDPSKKEHQRPGNVTVIIVPSSTGAEPKPSIELVRRVKAYLDNHRLPGVRLHVIGPSVPQDQHHGRDRPCLLGGGNLRPIRSREHIGPLPPSPYRRSSRHRLALGTRAQHRGAL
jgi:baseplate J-like protein